MKNKRDTQQKENKQQRIKKEEINRLHQIFIQILPNYLTHSYSQEFPLESYTKINLDILQDHAEQPSNILGTFTKDQPTNLLTTNTSSTQV